ncbi:hypothetical protein [Selenomonas sputigena]|uniref:hypothetical protein n=1 Tax=Selenomonas sputigena TaxID=69823 RepID=UPI002234B360|nr:hypothetical protein [Selenomonas sputigena]UZE44373.1 hypothetical protein OL236_07010 [Selenomonas sputigena]
MRMVNVPLNNMERRKFVKAARAKRSNVPQLLKRLALQQLGITCCWIKRGKLGMITNDIPSIDKPPHPLLN